MSVPASTNKVQYVIASLTPTLAVPFYFLEDAHVRVVRSRDGEADYPLVKDTHYTISGSGVASGGSIVLTGMFVQLNDRITVKRSIPLTQLTRYVANDRFPATTHEAALDKLTMIVQQISEIAERALIYGEGELMDGGNVLPGINARAERVLAFDEEGDLDLQLTIDSIRTLIIANPVDGLTDVVDYGSTGDPVTAVADYGSTGEPA